jgi:hypothetical protein
MACNELTLDDREMYRGDTYKFTATFEQPAGTPIDITGYTARLTVRESYPTASVTDDTDASIAKTGLIATGTDGKAQFEVVPADTYTLDIRNYFYDIELEETGGAKYTIGVGKFTINNEITRG